MSKQPYKLGRGEAVGGAAAKAGAEIGTAISTGIEAVTGVKKHRASLEHIASENALNRKHVKDTATHFAGIAKELGGNTKIEADADGAVRFRNKGGKKRNRNLSDAQHDGPPAGGSGRRGVTGPGGGPAIKPNKSKPSQPQPIRALPPGKPETKPANATVKPMLALPPGKSDAVKSANSDKMKTINGQKKARGITGGSKVAATAVRTRSAKNAANPKIYPAGVKSTPEQVKVNVARAWQDKKKTMRASKGAN